MISCNLMGGLGNQIFQIFATISYAIKSRNQFKFLNSETLGGGSTTLRYTFWKSFFSKLKPFLINIFPQSIHIITEKEFRFQELPVYEMIDRDVVIYGYFQSYKYFEENYDIICRLIGLETMKKKLLIKINSTRETFKNTISLHFRIGDYKNLQDWHPIMTKKYYYDSLNFIQSKMSNITLNVLYFCEDVDIDDVNEIIVFLKAKNPNIVFTRGLNTLEDWEQMLLMSLCPYNIIANSSFSWWSAYFNDYSDKIVCYPSTWFGPLAEYNTDDLCPPEWNRIFV